MTSAAFVKCGNKRVGDSGGGRMARLTPDPGLGAPIQLLGGDTGGLFDLVRIGKTLSC